MDRRTLIWTLSQSQNTVSELIQTIQTLEREVRTRFEPILQWLERLKDGLNIFTTELRQTDIDRSEGDAAYALQVLLAGLSTTLSAVEAVSLTNNTSHSFPDVPNDLDKPFAMHVEACNLAAAYLQRERLAQAPNANLRIQQADQIWIEDLAALKRMVTRFFDSQDYVDLFKPHARRMSTSSTVQSSSSSRSSVSVTKSIAWESFMPEIDASPLKLPPTAGQIEVGFRIAIYALSQLRGHLYSQDKAELGASRHQMLVENVHKCGWSLLFLRHALPRRAELGRQGILKCMIGSLTTIIQGLGAINYKEFADRRLHTTNPSLLVDPLAHQRYAPAPLPQSQWARMVLPDVPVPQTPPVHQNPLPPAYETERLDHETELKFDHRLHTAIMDYRYVDTDDSIDQWKQSRLRIFRDTIVPPYHRRLRIWICRDEAHTLHMNVSSHTGEFHQASELVPLYAYNFNIRALQVRNDREPRQFSYMDFNDIGPLLDLQGLLIGSHCETSFGNAIKFVTLESKAKGKPATTWHNPLVQTWVDDDDSKRRKSTSSVSNSVRSQDHSSDRRSSYPIGPSAEQIEVSRLLFFTDYSLFTVLIDSRVALTGETRDSEWHAVIRPTDHKAPLAVFVRRGTVESPATIPVAFRKLSQRGEYVEQKPDFNCIRIVFPSHNKHAKDFEESFDYCLRKWHKREQRALQSRASERDPVIKRAKP